MKLIIAQPVDEEVLGFDSTNLSLEFYVADRENPTLIMEFHDLDDIENFLNEVEKLLNKAAQ